MRNRFIPIVITGGAMLMTLAGCATSSLTATCEPVLSDGALVKNVSVLGGFGTEPNISIPQGFTVGAAQSSIIDKNEARTPVADKDSVLTINFALFDSATGAPFEQSESFVTGNGHDFVPVINGISQGSFLDSLECVSPGDRVLMAFAAEEAEAIVGSLSLPTGTNVIGLVDVHQVTPVMRDGKVRNLPSGFPGVITNDTGQPGVVLVPGNPPAEPKAAVRVEGSGNTVQDSDAVVANLMQVSWEGELIDNTWDTSGPRYLGASEDGIHDIRVAITGAKVGSQMVYIQPNGDNSASIYVVDVLAAG
ncbi:MAG TPA: hypothetical protein VLZ31_01945 [Microbacteriaceae bacterium]|nr:hypothetical protein [Microbacteriaceae bacterium]